MTWQQGASPFEEQIECPSPFDNGCKWRLIAPSSHQTLTVEICHPMSPTIVVQIILFLLKKENVYLAFLHGLKSKLTFLKIAALLNQPKMVWGLNRATQILWVCYTSWSTITATDAAKSVIAIAIQGLCPWATAKEVMIPAPNAAVTREPSKSFSCFLYMDATSRWFLNRFHRIIPDCQTCNLPQDLKSRFNLR